MEPWACSPRYPAATHNLLRPEGTEESFLRPFKARQGGVHLFLGLEAPGFIPLPLQGKSPSS